MLEDWEDPRTVVNIVEDLIKTLKDHEWNEEYSQRWNEWSTTCYHCGHDKGGHKSDCELDKLLKEAQAFIDVEQELELERLS